MKRSEFGFKEWLEFAPEYAHKFEVNKENRKEHIVRLGTSREFCGELDEACRMSVEHFCNRSISRYPWEQCEPAKPQKPDFSKWTREKCEDYILSIEGGAYISAVKNTRDISHLFGSLVVYIGNASEVFGDAPHGPTLKDYQNAAEWVYEKAGK